MSKDILSRSCGILLHPTSLPGPHGVGDLGPEAFQFIDDLHEAGQTWWQMLPVTPPGFGDSPYTSLSAFAGNPILINLEKLAEDGLIEPGDIGPNPQLTDDRVDFGRVKSFKEPLLRKAFARIEASPDFQDELASFRKKNSDWIEDWALFTAIKEHHRGRPWTEWPEELKLAEPLSLERAREEHIDEMTYQIFLQWTFRRQWEAVHKYAAKKKVKLLGDVPIFVAHDSADVWKHRKLFKLDENGQPSVVAGVPPDYFSPTGQRWGNPVYDWRVHAEDGYRWWIRRLENTFNLFDAVRLDHFIGFYRAWEIPATESTAVNGTWAAGPRAHFFVAVTKALDCPAIVAEDLGNVIPPVHRLRKKFNLPGMFVLHFAFGDDIDKARRRIRGVKPRTVVYTGTHDNDTTLGWYRSMGGGTEHAHLELKHALEIIGSNGQDICWDLIRFAYSTKGDLVIVPAQDWLGLDSWARMNRPGTNEGNWSWRLKTGQLSSEIKTRAKALAKEYDRSH